MIALERDVELEKRKNRDLQEASKERDREYQKLKVRRFLVLTDSGLTFARPSMIE
jgi:hypothetical protein